MIPMMMMMMTVRLNDATKCLRVLVSRRVYVFGHCDSGRQMTRGGRGREREVVVEEENRSSCGAGNK